ncbi:hypothetical protein L3X38_000026 [Prunus dulcis]|uniref:Leucine-rich repeat-containing N-terminal plant-type domain-containing protein n=1 Tax=Prunus dulcis TaxID=3755 RepID=A0AAD4YJZ4_PRUDU|nr:hypothetical protein L3X38_000026 [Prunus dulcis]
MKHLLQYFLLLFLIPKICFTIIPAVHSLCTKDQQLSLLHLKKSLQFSHDPDSDSYPTKVISWNSSTDCCSWLGVNCSSDGHVVGLDLSSEAINDGIDDSSSLFDLQHLQSLNLADNHFTYGTRIPSAIGKLVNLRYLNLSSCSFYGSIPKSIANLTQLVGLHLGLNMFSGSIDSISWENLTNLGEREAKKTKGILGEYSRGEICSHIDDVDISAQGAQWCQALSSSLPNLRVLSMSGTNLMSY